MTIADDIRRTAAVRWDGDVAHGKGSITTGSGKVEATYSFGTRFSGDPGTSPEELLAASHAACFTMALSAVLSRAGTPPTSIDTTAAVHLHRDGSSFMISAIELRVKAVVAGIDDATFQPFAGEAKSTCPLSKALSAVPISLIATLG